MRDLFRVAPVNKAYNHIHNTHHVCCVCIIVCVPVPLSSPSFLSYVTRCTRELCSCKYTHKRILQTETSLLFTPKSAATRAVPHTRHDTAATTAPRFTARREPCAAFCVEFFLFMIIMLLSYDERARRRRCRPYSMRQRYRSFERRERDLYICKQFVCCHTITYRAASAESVV